MKRIFVLVLVVAAVFSISACQDRKPQSAVKAADKKLVVVTTLFPLYDFARSIGGDKAEVTLLLPPGVEAHAFEPRPDDAVKTARAGLFIYTNRFMEPWAEKFVSGLGASNLLVVDAGKGITFLPATHKHGHEEEGHHDHDHKHAALDPHIWLDLEKARAMVENIAAAMITKDPANSATYKANATKLNQQLAALDADFRSGLSACKTKTFLHGGHYAFGYLANRYGLLYEAAIGVNADSEPTPARIIELVKQVRKSGVRYIFSEEMVSPRLTEAIANESGVKVLSLHNLHNVGKDDFQAGATYITLMRKNLENLKAGLECGK